MFYGHDQWDGAPTQQVKLSNLVIQTAWRVKWSLGAMLNQPTKGQEDWTTKMGVSSSMWHYNWGTLKALCFGFCTMDATWLADLEHPILGEMRTQPQFCWALPPYLRVWYPLYIPLENFKQKGDKPSLVKASQGQVFLLLSLFSQGYRLNGTYLNHHYFFPNLY
jgi:hypothetical protein